MDNRPIEATFISRRSLTPTLEIFESDGTKTSKVIVTDCVIVGRSKQADISLDDDKLSRNHFMIAKTDGRFEIKDLNSSNGLVVNGKKVKTYTLTGNDKIIAGETSFHFAITREDLRSEQVLSGEPSFKGGDLFNKKYSKASRINLRNKALLSSLTAGILIFAVTLTLLSYEKDAKVSPIVKKGTQLKTLVNIEQEIAASGLKEEEKNKARNYFNIAKHHFEAKNYPLAKTTMAVYYEIIPNSVIAPLFIAACDEAMSKEVAIDDKIDDIQKDADRRELIANLLKQGNSELSNGNNEEAISIFTKVISIDEYNEQAYDGLITAERQIAEKEKNSITGAETTLNLRPEGTVFASQMDRAYKNGNYTKAYELALRITKMGQEKAGREPFINAVKTNRNIIATTNRLYGPMVNEANLLARSDAGDEALKVYRKILAMFPYQSGAKAGITKVMADRHEQAKYLYAKALVENSYPNNSEAKSKLKMILGLVPSNDVYHQKAVNELKKMD